VCSAVRLVLSCGGLRFVRRWSAVRSAVVCGFQTYPQAGYVIVVVCLFVSLLATLLENFGNDLHVIFREDWQWASEQMIKFQWRSGSASGYRNVFRIRHYWKIRKVVNGLILIRQMAALVRRALAEVCTVPVLLVLSAFVVGERCSGTVMT